MVPNLHYSGNDGGGEEGRREVLNPHTIAIHTNARITVALKTDRDYIKQLSLRCMFKQDFGREVTCRNWTLVHKWTKSSVDESRVRVSDSARYQQDHMGLPAFLERISAPKTAAPFSYAGAKGWILTASMRFFVSFRVFEITRRNLSSKGRSRGSFYLHGRLLQILSPNRL